MIEFQIVIEAGEAMTNQDFISEFEQGRVPGDFHHARALSKLHYDAAHGRRALEGQDQQPWAAK